ncbi:tail fiber/spike domain-containing protein, partial [Klebsiella variicola]
MTRLPESSLWEEEIELISRRERVSGGLDGVANRPLKSLANRTRFLKEKADESDEIVAEKVSAVKTFAEGATLNSPREEILYGAYRLVWTGEFPKTVPAASSPQSTGGLGAGRWAYTSDAAIRSSLGSEKEGQGDAIVMRKLGGSVNAALRYVSVDGFDPDLTGETDSTPAVLKAAAVAKTLADSAYRAGDTTYYVVKFGFGIYMLGDVPLYSGISYQGQWAGTLIRPLPGAEYCLTTVGTEKYDPANLKRMFYPAISNLFIGCGFFEPLFEVPEGVGGINIKHASYLKLENISIRHLDGCGMNLSEVWDS